MAQTSTQPKPGRGEEWSEGQIELLASADVNALRSNEREARLYVRRLNPFLADLLDSEVETQ